MQPVPSNFKGLLWERGDRTYYYEVSDQWTAGETGFTGDYEYFLYLSPTGSWILQQHQISVGSWRYVTGQSGYVAFLPLSSNLTALAALSWTYYNLIFG